MNLRFRWACMKSYARHVPWVDPVTWKKEDAIALKTFLGTASGKKMAAYFTNFVLRQQADALISESNLKYKSGGCVGAKAILSQLDSLSDAENFTDEEGSD